MEGDGRRLVVDGCITQRNTEEKQTATYVFVLTGLLVGSVHYPACSEKTRIV